MKHQTLKEQVDEIRSNRRKARADYWNFGGLGYPNTKDEQTLIAYIRHLESENEALRNRTVIIAKPTEDA